MRGSHIVDGYWHCEGKKLLILTVLDNATKVFTSHILHTN